MNLDELTNAVAAWDGTLEAALSLRAAARLTEPSKSAPTNDLARVVARVVGMYRSGKQPTLDQLEDAADWRGYAPFLGDEFGRPGQDESVQWPYEDVDLLDDAVAARWMQVLGRPHIATAGALAAMNTLFDVRPRNLWQPAAIALARHAVRNEVALASLRERWTFAFPDGVPKKWGAGDGPASTPTSAESGPAPTAHQMRHILVAACAFVAAGGAESALPKFTAAAVEASPLPKEDPTNASILLKCLALLSTGASPHPTAATALSRVIDSVPPDAQCFDELKALHSVIGPDSASLGAKIVERLARPSFAETNQSRALEAAWVWLETIRWLRAGIAPARVEELVAAAGPLKAAALRITEPCGDDIGRRASELLPTVLDPDVRETTPRLAVVGAACELLELFQTPGLAHTSWPALARRAHVSDPLAGTLDSKTGDMGRVALALALADAGMNTAFLLRDVRLELDGALALATRRNGAVIPQAAVQFERLIRGARAHGRVSDNRVATSPSSRAEPSDGPTRAFELLWQLVRVDPPTEVFKQLDDQLRASENEVRALTRALADLDASRGTADLAPRYVECVTQALPLLRGSGSNSGRAAADILDSLAEAVRRLGAAAPPASLGAWPLDRLDAFGDLLVGAKGPNGLDAWIEWWGARRASRTDESAGVSEEGGALRIAWAGLRAVVEETQGRLRVLTEQDAGRVGGAIDRLRESLTSCVWPEQEVVDSELRRLRAWHADLVTAAEEGRVVSQQVTDAVTKGRLTDAMHFLEQPGRAQQLSADATRSLHTALLGARDWPGADRVRTLAAAHVALPPAEIAEVEDYLAKRDEAQCTAFVERPANWSQMPPALAVRLHGFLLQTWNLNAARTLRVARDDLELPSTSQHIAPLLLGVASGPMIVADVASDWLELATLDAMPAYIAMVVLGHAGALGLLMSECPAGRQPTLPGRLASKVARIGPTWLKALGTATIASTVALALKPGGAWQDPKTLVLWSSLSLFLGTFLGVVAQGRRLAGKSE